MIRSSARDVRALAVEPALETTGSGTAHFTTRKRRWMTY